MTVKIEFNTHYIKLNVIKRYAEHAKENKNIEF